MARVTPLFNHGVPTFVFQGIPFAVPVDLPEGGWLQVVVGENPNVPATPSVKLEPGQMVAIIPAQVAAQIRGGLDAAEKLSRDPAGMVRGANGKQP